MEILCEITGLSKLEGNIKKIFIRDGGFFQFVNEDGDTLTVRNTDVV